MASSGKWKTTMSKLTRENKLRERRIEKQAKKAARKLAATDEQNRPAAASNGLAWAESVADGSETRTR
jgi:hypothetical protein